MTNLTETEKETYALLVDMYVLAKLMKDYSQSDKLRIKLYEFNRWSDEDYIKMYTTKKYRWHPFYESQEHCNMRLGMRNDENSVYFN